MVQCYGTTVLISEKRTERVRVKSTQSNGPGVAANADGGRVKEQAMTSFLD